MGVTMRITVNSAEGGKPFEMFEAADNNLDEPGWYYTLMQWVPGNEVDALLGTTGNEGRFEPLDIDEGPEGPFSSLNEAFCDAIASGFYDIDPIGATPYASLADHTKPGN